MGRPFLRSSVLVAVMLVVPSLSGCQTEAEKRADEAARAAVTQEITSGIIKAEKDGCLERGYEHYANGVCFRWLDRSDPKHDCGYSHGSCSVMEVSPIYGCNSLYVEANIEDSSGMILGYTNDIAKGIPAEGSALIKLSSFEKGADKVAPTQLTCR